MKAARKPRAIANKFKFTQKSYPSNISLRVKGAAPF
jgi:hypothetical protein